jgi:hypothetical protein
MVWSNESAGSVCAVLVLGPLAHCPVGTPTLQCSVVNLKTYLRGHGRSWPRLLKWCLDINLYDKNVVWHPAFVAACRDEPARPGLLGLTPGFNSSHTCDGYILATNSFFLFSPLLALSTQYGSVRRWCLGSER